MAVCAGAPLNQCVRAVDAAELTAIGAPEIRFNCMMQVEVGDPLLAGTSDVASAACSFVVGSCSDARLRKSATRALPSDKLGCDCTVCPVLCSK